MPKKPKSEGQKGGRMSRLLEPPKNPFRSRSPSPAPAVLGQSHELQLSPPPFLQSESNTTVSVLAPPANRQTDVDVTASPARKPTSQAGSVTVSDEQSATETPSGHYAPQGESLGTIVSVVEGSGQVHSVTVQSVSDAQQVAPDLWSKAYEELPEEYKQNLQNPDDKLDILQKLFDLAIQAKEQKLTKRFKLKWGGQEIDVQERAEGFVSCLNRFKEIGDIVVQYDPGHAALPWAGVRFILMLVIEKQEKLAAAIIGMERIAILINRCTIYEQLYLCNSDIPDIAQNATKCLCEALITLYTATLQALSRLMKIFGGKSNPFKTPEATIAEIKLIERPESVVDSAASIVENCYGSHARFQNRGEFVQLRTLLEGFSPVMSRMDTTVSAIYEEIKEHERITILDWFSTIPYKSHHDHAHDGCVEHTGRWLFKRAEFTGWQQSRKANLLWLHGIPGAGKTKLVSATIEYLNSNPDVRFDKVAYFYCKQDEENRRDRHKILLALVKQLACPLSTDTGIYTEAREVYEMEQKDRSARCQLSIKASLHLLAQLLKYYKHPAIILDALDECPEEARRLIIGDLRSILDDVAHPVKLFISSRDSQDIRNRLQGLPHVRIEAKDNAKDIENYVTKELALRIKDKRLLRGTISPGLEDLIKQTLLTNAGGMFLWVDYQLRELCKLNLESDIRARLGKLPSGLTGVYDEIMKSIELRPGSDFTLAARALKWMLVAQKPLKPRELVAATELDPSSIQPDRTNTQSLQPVQSSLDIQPVIHVCGGLIVLDQQLKVMRFAHLSVQEYLETRKNSWGIIDAQRFVSEGCLWTLQWGPPLDSRPLYRYAACNWFRHCRAYQDLVLSSCLQFNLTMEIPILKTFLRSFNSPSASFAEWAAWVRLKYVSEGLELYRTIQSKPLRPAFAAAVCGLGELVSWFWHSEDADMRINNCDDQPLLHLASEYGTPWILDCIMTHEAGADINIVCGDYHTALGIAANRGRLDLVTLLLDRGADINIVGGDYGTALGIAVNHGRLDVVTLLLDRGADINIVGGDYGTALGIAVNNRRLDLATLLLDRGADINIVGGMYGTALEAAAVKGTLEIVTLLLDRGADINIVGGGYGTALEAATLRGELEIATLLLDRGADINIVGGNYGTALGTAAVKGKLEIVALLLDRGADINIVGGKYGTALGDAAYWGRLDIITLLLDRGADINIIFGGMYGTALGAAAARGQLKIATLLLDRGVDINITFGGEHGTALCAAAASYKEENALKLVSLLLNRGANPALTNVHGQTPRDLAESKGHQAVVKLLDAYSTDRTQNQTTGYRSSHRYGSISD